MIPLDLHKLWQFRSYIAGSIVRDFKLRFKGSVLGLLLVFLLPAFQISLYILVFGHLLKGRLPGNSSLHGYSIYLCGGILFWNFFSDLLLRTQSTYTEHANLLKKTAFPSSALVLINLASSSVNLLLNLSLLAIFLMVSSAFPGWQILVVLPVWLVLALLAIASGLCFAILQVFFRDVGALTSILLQAFFWGTPIVYPLQILPDWLSPWLLLNPLLWPISAAQASLLGNPMPALQSGIATLLAMAVATILATSLHRHHRADLLDNL